MLSLDPVLATAQNSLSRHPIVEIISSQLVDDIPFDGALLTAETTNEDKPNLITHSSGRLCLVYTFDSPTAVLKYCYTDSDRTMFTTVTIDPPSNHEFVEASLCELANGDIGIVYHARRLSDQYHILRQMVLTVEGEVVSADSQIAAYVLPTAVYNPWISRLQNGSFLLVYVKKDGANWYIMKRTAAAGSFGSFGAESALSISGFNIADARYNPSLIQISNGNIFIWCDYVDQVGPNDEELTNVYYSISTDNGSTWGAAVKITSYTQYSPVGKHPIALQKAVDQLHLIYNEQTAALHMDSSTSGWCEPNSYVTDLHFDEVNRKLYVLSTYASAGMKRMLCVVKIDVDTWTIDDCWDCASVPSFQSMYCVEHVWYQVHHGDGRYVPVGIVGTSGQIHAALLDGESDTIRNYNFTSWGAYGITANVTWSPVGGTGWLPSLSHTFVDAANGRFYVVISNNYSGNRVLQIGYFVIGGDNTFHEIVREVNQVTEMEMFGIIEGDFVVYQNLNLFFMSYAHTNTGSSFPGRLRIHVLSDGSVWKDYKKSTHVNFPFHGLREVVYRGIKVYGVFKYDATVVGETDKRGLCIIDTGSDGIIFSRPTWATVDEYYLEMIHVNGEGKMIISSGYYGITVYDPAEGTWILHSNATIPGLTPDASNRFYPVGYDDAGGIIFAGTASTAYWLGLVAFSVYGTMKQSKYRQGQYVGSWAFGAQSSLCRGILDFDMAASLDPNDKAIYGFWVNQKKSELSIKWDREGTDFDLTPYLLNDSDIEVRRSIEGSPSSLKFSVSHGHLFDPHNTLSLWSIYLQKFRFLNLRFGEKIGLINYWQQAGEFIVKNTRLSWERPKYPVMEVEAEDRRVFWEFANMIATPYYETSPKIILEDILTTFAGFDPADLNFPTFDQSETLYQQWIDTAIKDVLDQVCNRFGYHFRIEVDGKASARKISDANPINHIYAGTTWLKNYSPDDSFSDYVNRVIVCGEGRDYIEVLYNEEALGTLSGTVGWWGHKKHKTFWYAEDGSRRCRFPRLEVIESVREFNFKLGHGSEHISSTDPSERFCIITIDTPNMVGWLIGLIVAYIVLAIVCVLCDCEFLCGVCALSKALILEVVLYIISSMASYQYRIHAQPVGNVRQSYQATSNDLDLQNLIGTVVERKFEDPLCYTLEGCQLVANFEILVAKLQRKRLKLTKLAHLQDEEGDTIQIPHPYTGAVMRVFLTDVTRKFKVPSDSGAGSGSGYFVDELEGWRLE